jgi:hypothetical protein
MAVSNPAPKTFDEYIERDAAGKRQLRKYEAEIASGQRRLDCPNDAIVQSEWNVGTVGTKGALSVGIPGADTLASATQAPWCYTRARAGAILARELRRPCRNFREW